MKKIILISTVIVCLLVFFLFRFVLNHGKEAEMKKEVKQEKITEMIATTEKVGTTEAQIPSSKPEILTKLEKENERLTKQVAKKDKELETLKAEKTKKKKVAKKHRKVEKVKTPEKCEDKDREEIREIIKQINEKLNELERSKQAEIQEYEAEPEEEYYEEAEDYETYPVYYRPIVYVGLGWPFYYSYWIDWWWYLGRYPSYYYNLWRWDPYYGCYYTHSSLVYIPRKGRLTVITKDQLENKNNSRLTMRQYKSNLSKNITTKSLQGVAKVPTKKKALSRTPETDKIGFPSRIPKQKIQKIKGQTNLGRGSGGISRRDSGKYQTPFGDSRLFDKSPKSASRDRSNLPASRKSITRGSSKRTLTRQSASRSSVSRGRTPSRSISSSRSSRSTTQSSGKVRRKK